MNLSTEAVAWTAYGVSVGLTVCLLAYFLVRGRLVQRLTPKEWSVILLKAAFMPLAVAWAAVGLWAMAWGMF